MPRKSLNRRYTPVLDNIKKYVRKNETSIRQESKTEEEIKWLQAPLWKNLGYESEEQALRMIRMNNPLK